MISTASEFLVQAKNQHPSIALQVMSSLVYARGAGACLLLTTRAHTRACTHTHTHAFSRNHCGTHDVLVPAGLPQSRKAWCQTPPGMLISDFHPKLNARIDTDTPTSPITMRTEAMTWHAYGTCISPTPTSLDAASMVFTLSQDRFIVDTPCGCHHRRA